MRLRPLWGRGDRIQSMSGPNRVVYHAVVLRAMERAKAAFQKTHKPASGWGSLLSFTGLAKSDEPPVEMLFDALVVELGALSRAEVLDVAPPPDGAKKRVFASALAVTAAKLVPGASLAEAEELFDRTNAVYASLTSSDPQVRVEHGRVMVEWMEWRLHHEHLYDTALYYVVEAEYQLHDAMAPGILTSPSEETLAW